MWLYAICQLALVVCFAHIFYDVVGVESVLSILLSAFVGFGIAMLTSTLIIEIHNFKQRTAQRARRGREVREGVGSVSVPETGAQVASGDQQSDQVVLQMEGGGFSSLWRQPSDHRAQVTALRDHRGAATSLS